MTFILMCLFLNNTIEAGKNDLANNSMSYVPYPTDWSNFDTMYEQFKKSQKFNAKKKFDHLMLHPVIDKSNDALTLFDHPMLPPSIDNSDDDASVISTSHTSQYYQIARRLASYVPCLNKARNCSLEEITSFICEIFSKLEEDCLWNSLSHNSQLKQRFRSWAIKYYWNILFTRYSLQKRTTELEKNVFLLLQKVCEKELKYRNKHIKL